MKNLNHQLADKSVEYRQYRLWCERLCEWRSHHTDCDLLTPLTYRSYIHTLYALHTILILYTHYTHYIHTSHTTHNTLTHYKHTFMSLHTHCNHHSHNAVQPSLSCNHSALLSLPEQDWLEDDSCNWWRESDTDISDYSL